MSKYGRVCEKGQNKWKPVSPNFMPRNVPTTSKPTSFVNSGCWYFLQRTDGKTLKKKSVVVSDGAVAEMVSG